MAVLKYYLLFKKEYSWFKKLVNLIVWIFILAGFYLLFTQREFSNYYRPRFMAIIAFLSVFLITLPYWLRQKSNKKARLKFLASEESEVFAALTLSFNGLGALGLYSWHLGYDSLTHFFNSIMIGLMFYTLFLVNKNCYECRSCRLKAALFSLASVLAVGFIFEGYEKFGDFLFKTQMSGELGESLDTKIDLFYNGLGALVAAILGYCYGNKWVEKFI